MSEQEHGRRVEGKPSTPVLTIAAFALLFMIPVFLVAGNIEVSDERITIDLPLVDLRGADRPDFDMGR